MEKAKLKDDKLYLKKDLLEYLGSKGLPCSYPTLLKYEKLGIIPSPRRNIDSFFKDKWRLYSGKEIKKIAKVLEKKLKR